MNRKRIAEFAIFCSVLFIGAILLHTTASAQRAAPVEVQNTTANPVPVTGSVAVTNSPTVKIDSSQPVSVTGALRVENAVGGSLLTRNLDSPTRQRVYKSFFGEGAPYVVPAGKLLVIDYVSGAINSNTAPIMEVDAGNGRWYFLTPNTSFEYFGSRIWIWGTQTQMFFPAGSLVGFRQFISFGVVGNFSFHGYLVDMP